jgi:Helix-turn-helix domain
MTNEEMYGSEEIFYNYDKFWTADCILTTAVYTKQRAAKLLGVNATTINNWMKTGKIAYAIVNHNKRNKIAIPQSEVVRLSTSHPQILEITNFTFLD